MKVNFLEAHVPLTKKLTVTSKEPYPHAFEFKSHEHIVKDLSHFTQLIEQHGKLGHCLLKGELTKQLNWESRAGSTNPNQTTQWLCLDIDGLSFVSSIDDMLKLIGLDDCSYILQWSASAFIYDRSIRAHVFVMLKTPVATTAIKTWLKQVNLTVLQPDLSLTKTYCSLKWTLDITTCQNDKLLFIAPPQCDPASLDPFVGRPRTNTSTHTHIPAHRVELVRKNNDLFNFASVTLLPGEKLKELEEAAINTLRQSAGLTERKSTQFKIKTHKGESYFANPDQATVTSVKEERNFVYLNLNGGDSWGYYHPTDNATFIYNFKGEPTYKTSELLPDYWDSVQHARRQAVQQTQRGKLFLAFRDFRSSEYFNGWYDQNTEELVLHKARSEKQIVDFLDNYGQPILDSIPIWELTFEPHKDTIDLVKREVNLFKPSHYMTQTKINAQAHKVSPLLTPTIDLVISHVFGDANYYRFFNWLAFCFKERTAPKTAWVAHGVPGTGKGILMNNIISPLIGQSNVTQRRVEELEDKFNGYLENCLICNIDEAQISDSKRADMIMANIKNQITEPRITIRNMRQSAYEVENRVGFIFSSNKPDPVIIEHGDRRFNIGDYQPNKLFMTDTLMASIQNELMDFAIKLSQHHIDLDMVRTPELSEAKEEMMLVSRSSADAIADAIKDGRLDVLWDALPTIDISMLDVATALKLQPYKQLVTELVTTRRDRITREELYVIFNYNVGKVPSSPYKLTVYLRHHGIQIKDIWLGTRTRKGMIVKWANTEEWFAQQNREIEAESKPAKLKVVSNKEV